MPQYGNQDYKNSVFEQLSKGSSAPTGDEDHFQHFENFSAGAPRRDVEAGVGEALHPEKISSEEVEPQFRTAAEKMQPQERSEIAQDLLGELQKRGLAPSWLQKMLGLGSTDPRQASPDDIAKLTEYSRQNHPEVFHGRQAISGPVDVQTLGRRPGRDHRRQAPQPPVRQVTPSQPRMSRIEERSP